MARTAGSIGSNFTKAQYKQYTDATFTTPVEQPAWQGILGPTLVTEVGQALEIVFQNRLDLPANLMLDGGLELLPAGADGKDVSLVAPVAPGGNATYRYYVPERWARGGAAAAGSSASGRRAWLAARCQHWRSSMPPR